jgi:hypothetical protein
LLLTGQDQVGIGRCAAEEVVEEIRKSGIAGSRRTAIKAARARPPSSSTSRNTPHAVIAPRMAFP